jgi:hypothetical protein
VEARQLSIPLARAPLEVHLGLLQSSQTSNGDMCVSAQLTQNRTLAARILRAQKQGRTLARSNS